MANVVKSVMSAMNVNRQLAIGILMTIELRELNVECVMKNDDSRNEK